MPGGGRLSCVSRVSGLGRQAVRAGRGIPGRLCSSRGPMRGELLGRHLARRILLHTCASPRTNRSRPGITFGDRRAALVLRARIRRRRRMRIRLLRGQPVTQPIAPGPRRQPVTQSIARPVRQPVTRPVRRPVAPGPRRQPIALTRRLRRRVRRGRVRRRRLRGRRLCRRRWSGRLWCRAAPVAVAVGRLRRPVAQPVARMRLRLRRRLRRCGRPRRLVARRRIVLRRRPTRAAPRYAVASAAARTERARPALRRLPRRGRRRPERVLLRVTLLPGIAVVLRLLRRARLLLLRRRRRAGQEGRLRYVRLLRYRAAFVHPGRVRQ